MLAPPSTDPPPPRSARAAWGAVLGGAAGGALVGCADALVALESTGVAGGRLLLLPTALALGAVGAAAAAPWALALARRGRLDDANPRWWGVGPGAAAAAWVCVATGPLAGAPLASAAAGVALLCLGLAAVALARTTRARIFTMAGLVAALSIPVSLVGRPPLGPPPAPPARSVVLVTLEGWQAADPPLEVTAALAGQGVRFAAVVSPSPSPEVALRGLHLGASAWAPGGLDPDSPLPPSATLGERFARAGWRTAAVVGRPGAAPRPRGFQRVDARDDLLPGAADTAPLRAWARLMGARPPRRRADRVVDRAADWWSRPEVADRPRFLWVHLADGAFPQAPPPPWDTALYAGDPYDPAHASGPPLPAAVRAQWPEITDAAWVRAQRLGALSAADAAVGALLERLDDAAVVAVLGVGATPPVTPGGPDPQQPTLDPALLRAPLVLRAPGLLPSGAVVPGPVEGTDLAATLLELSGARVDGEAGASLVPLAFGRRGPPFARAGLAGAGVRIVGAEAVWGPEDGPAPDPSWAMAADEVAAALAPAP